MTIPATTAKIQPFELSKPSKSLKAMDEEPTLEDIHLEKPSDFDTMSFDTEEETVGVESSSPEEEIDFWPQSFYCHRTHDLLIDPVVGPDGYSVERSTTTEQDDGAYYPNRALQAVIEESVALKQDLIRASLRAFQKSVSRGLVHLLPESTTANEPLFRPLNDAFYCSITYNLMHQPVIDPEGNTFEKVAVENWIKVNQSSPITRTPLSLAQLYPNTAIQQLLEEEKAKPIEEMHPSIRKWKDEPVPMATDVELGGNALLEQQRQQQNPNLDSTIFVITASYPITPSEWATREEARRRAIYNVFGFFFAAVCLTGFVLYGSIFFLMLFVLTVMILFSKRQRNDSAANRNVQQQQLQGGHGGQPLTQQQLQQLWAAQH